MNIIEATASYERWLSQQLTVLAGDLKLKHETMAQSGFAFLRATFYRFMQLWEHHAGPAAPAARVLAVGDLHVANYGTWRDVEGRLIWGINDFDELFPLPYTVDLVRLALSAHIATDENHLAIAAADACDSILAGYQEGLASGGSAFVLEQDHHRWLRETVTSDLRDPAEFWSKFAGLEKTSEQIPKPAQKGMEKLLPEGAVMDRVVHRIAGLGSLGRQRFVLLANLHGAPIAREAKALCASACLWAGWKGGATTPMYPEAIRAPLRAADPFVRIRQDWIIRRLAPYCSRVDLASLPKQREESKLLRAMGFELANVHLGTKGAQKKITADLKRRPGHWLHQAAAGMKKATMADFEEWKTADHAGPAKKSTRGARKRR